MVCFTRSRRAEPPGQARHGASNASRELQRGASVTLLQPLRLLLLLLLLMRRRAKPVVHRVDMFCDSEGTRARAHVKGN